MPPPFVRVEDMKRRYEREAAVAATPVPYLIMLCDETILSLRLADVAFARGDLEAVDDALGRALDVLLALRTYLWDEGTDLTHLYRDLLDANRQKNQAQAARVLSVLEELAGDWRRAAEAETAEVGA
jgi:flagellin-specific chaperone FliS